MVGIVHGKNDCFKAGFKNYKENGWIVFKKVFKKNEIQKYKNNIFKYLKTNHKKI